MRNIREIPKNNNPGNKSRINGNIMRKSNSLTANRPHIKKNLKTSKMANEKINRQKTVIIVHILITPIRN